MVWPLTENLTTAITQQEYVMRPNLQCAGGMKMAVTF